MFPGLALGATGLVAERFTSCFADLAQRSASGRPRAVWADLANGAVLLATSARSARRGACNRTLNVADFTLGADIAECAGIRAERSRVRALRAFVTRTLQ